MFELNGKRTSQSLAVQAIIDSAKIPFDAWKDDSFAITLYRRDPLDGYRFLVASAGLREMEPMYGPRKPSTDFGRREIHKRSSDDQRYGFVAREETLPIETFEAADWQLNINRRKDTDTNLYGERIMSDLKQRISEFFATDIQEIEKGKISPIYPDLWYQERMARDLLRSNFQLLRLGPSLERASGNLTVSLEGVFKDWVKSSAISVGVRIGIYLDTGTGWQLCGRDADSTMLPTEVERQPPSTQPNENNAFEWVARSLCPVLIGKYIDIGPQWRDRILKCGDELQHLTELTQFSGMCIAPILDIQEPDRTVGLMLVSAIGPELYPAHLYLLSRLSIGISGYLVPLFPISGFGWWSDAKLQRGGAEVSGPHDEDSIADEKSRFMSRLVKVAAKELLPWKSKVTLSQLRLGQSGACVFKINVEDEKGIPEIPRVLKIGPANIIEQELKKYYHYVHNKTVGGASRIDSAKVIRGVGWGPEGKSSNNATGNDGRYGAIVYTLVGGGEYAIPWSEWGKLASSDQLKVGVKILYDQLSPWQGRMKPKEEGDAFDEFIGKLADDKLESHISDDVKMRPSLKEVRDLITKTYHSVRQYLRVKTNMPTCICHGDLHCDNIFAIISTVEYTAEDRIEGVGLIDWERVQSGRHPLNDISRLMCDFAYKVKCNEKSRKLAKETVEWWGERKGCGDLDWRFAMMYQISVLLFWFKSPEHPSESYLESDARKMAWIDLKELSKNLIQAAKSLSREKS